MVNYENQVLEVHFDPEARPGPTGNGPGRENPSDKPAGQGPPGREILVSWAGPAPGRQKLPDNPIRS
jgi:hypothetical protein